MSESRYELSPAIKSLNALHTTNKYYLFADKLIVCDKNDETIKIIYPPSDNKSFAKHMLVKFGDIYYRQDYVVVIVSTRLWDCWFKLLEDKLELSEEYHEWR